MIGNVPGTFVFRKKSLFNVYSIFVMIFVVQAVFSGTWMYAETTVLLAALVPFLISVYLFVRKNFSLPFFVRVKFRNSKISVYSVN